jgi:hypothetical protein
LAKWQKVAITIPKRFGPTERQAIAQDVIDFIITRTRDGKDKDGKSFPGAYSKQYRQSLDYKIAGKPKSGKPINLTLSGEMLDELGLLNEKPGALTIGYDRGNKINGKVEGNRLGTYGTDTPKKSRARDFLGIHATDLKKILDKYKEDGEDKAKKELAAKSKSEKIVKGIEFQEPDEGDDG